MDPALARHIMAHHREENLRLQKHFFPHVSFEKVFGGREQDGPGDDERLRISRERAGQLQKRVIWDLLERL
ncbi:hypothetical protein R3F72_12675 [Salinicola sp. 4072]|tara:strand:- start:224 stop:436 length:213 start_codon:yes stop_codon:yes gene_type:complete